MACSMTAHTRGLSKFTRPRALRVEVDVNLRLANSR